MRHGQFSAYLEGLRSEAAAPAYCDHAAAAEKALGFNLDNADLSAQGITALIARLQVQHPAAATPANRAALEAYAQFMAYYRAR